ncbi:MAG: AI-2E family transporter [Thermoflexales bacterium]|nr:AI-2E family transporter [Thermoflexales bacterium]
MKSGRNTLWFLLTLAVVLYLLEKLWQFGNSLGNLVMIFALAWLIAFIFRPLADWLSARPIPAALIERARARWGDKAAGRLEAIRMPYAVSATLIYVTLLGLLVVAAVSIIPAIIKQAILLGANWGGYISQVPVWFNSLQDDLARRFNTDPQLLSRLYDPQKLAGQIMSIGPSLVSHTAGVIGRVASGLSTLLVVLALSYYMMLDGKRLSKQFYKLIPERYLDEVEFATRTLDKTFGGFLRGQVLMAVIEGVVTAVAAGIAGLPYGVLIGAVCGIVMIIPMIGAPIAMFTPSIIALLGGDTGAALGLLVFLILFQQILLHLLVPRMMSETLGMPSVLVLSSVLVGVHAVGVMGFIFAIPVAAAIYALGVVVLERYKREQDRLDAEVVDVLTSPGGEHDAQLEL